MLRPAAKMVTPHLTRRMPQVQQRLQSTGPNLGNNLNGPPEEGSRRPALGQDLMGNLMGSNWFATSVFKTMNWAMYMEGQPLPSAHEEVLRQALITEKKGVLDTLIAENPHVLASNGTTPIYLMGKYLVHLPLSKCLQERE